MNGRTAIHPDIRFHFHNIQEINLNFQSPSDSYFLGNYAPVVQIEAMESGDYKSRRWAEFNAQKDALYLAEEALCIIINPNNETHLKPLTQDHLDALRSIPTVAEDIRLIDHPQMKQLLANEGKTKHLNRFFQPTKTQLQEMYSAYREGYNYSSPPTRRW